MTILPPAMARLPVDTFAPAATRTLLPFGAAIELVHLPHRAARPDQPLATRPPFAADRTPQILAAEALWRGDDVVVTPNLYPFARAQTIVWSQARTREHPEALLAFLFGWNDRDGGSGLLNTIGAAASIARAHAHRTPETLPFLAGLRERPTTLPMPAVDGVTWIQKDVPFCLVGARGPAAARAAAIARALQLRTTAAINVVDTGGTAWLYPRAVETPAPHFPAALGAAEVWGRFCYSDAAAFARATAADLERALTAAGVPAATG